MSWSPSIRMAMRCSCRSARLTPSASGRRLRRQLQRPRRNELVLLHHRAARAVAALVALLQAFVAAEAAGWIGVKREDRVARQHEAAGERAEHRIRRAPVRGMSARGERHDLVAVVLQCRAVAEHAEHAVEVPFAILVPDGGFARHRRDAPGGVAVHALGAPRSRLEEEGVLYPCSSTESFGACERWSIV